MKQRCKKRVLSFVLVISLLISGISYGGARETQVAEAVSFNTVMSAVNGVATVASRIGAAVGNVKLLGSNASGGKKALAVIDGLLGTNFAVPSTGQRLKDISESVSKIEDKVTALETGVNEINSKMNIMNNKLDTIDSKLDKQQETLAVISNDVANLTTMMTATSNQISGVSKRLETLIGDQTDDIKITLFNSTVELQDTMTLLGKLDKYYETFSGLASVENTILDNLETKQKTYESFMEAVAALENGEQTMLVLNKLSTNYQESYNELSDDEKALLEQKVSVSGVGNVKVGKYLSDYLSYMHDYMINTVYSMNSGYISNLYDTTKLMGEYITGGVKDVGSIGVGEIFYRSSMIEKSSSEEVHTAYQSFMSNVLRDYYVTAYLCSMSLAYQIAYESENDGNIIKIADKRRYLNNITDQMAKVEAYYDYELNHCIQEYDFKGYKDGEYEQYICYYGNTVNAKQGISDWLSKKKADMYDEAALSDVSMTIAVAEEKPLFFYQGYKDRTKNVNWISEDETVAVVNSDGSVTGVSPGNAVIVGEFDTYRLECQVTVKNCYAVKNDKGQSVYHYGSKEFSMDAVRSYDYYYGTECYTGKKMVIDKDKIAVGLVEATGLTEKEVELYTWSSSNIAVADCKDGQITLTDDGTCVIHGYRYLEDLGIYESIGIPVCSKWDTSAEMESVEEHALKDYVGYTKISSKEDLVKLSKTPDKWGPDCKYVLTADIDLEGMEWEPIGYKYVLGDGLLSNYGNVSCSFPFEGVFEGNGHTIKNYKITTLPKREEMIQSLIDSYEKYSSEKYFSVKNNVASVTLGLFGYVSNGRISNLNVTGGTIQLTDTTFGESFTIGGNEYKFKMDKDTEVYAGMIVGSSSSSYGGAFTRALAGDNAFLKSEQIDGNNRFSVNPDCDVSEYTKDMPEAIRALGNDSDAYALNVLLEYLKKSVNKTPVQHCYAKGNITISAAYAYVGGLFGLCTTSVSDSVADVDINVATTGTSGNKGGLGGLIGKWQPGKNDKLIDCTSYTHINSATSDSAGGLSGVAESMTIYDLSKLAITEQEVTEAGDDSEALNEKAASAIVNIMLFIVFNDMAGGIVDCAFDNTEYKNTSVDNCQVYGSIHAGGDSAGLFGRRENNATVYDITMPEEDGSNEGETEYSHTNMDIYECYVDADISTTGDNAAGIIGYMERDFVKDVEYTEKKAGSIDNCYVHGNISAGKVAAGVIAANYSGDSATVDGDDLSISDLVVACESIHANTVAANTDTAAYPICAPSVNSFIDTSRVAYYNLIDYEYMLNGESHNDGDATDYTNQGMALTLTDMNKADTYMKLWGTSFCNLRGLDYNKDIIPTVFDERYFFNTDKVKKHYYVGDTFQPLTTGILYTGTGSVVVGKDEGIMSTAPDMSEAGIRKVTVSCNGRFAKDYIVYIYPVKENYIKVTKKPVLVRDEGAYTIRGGEVGVYLSDGTLSDTISIDDCDKEYGDGYVGITYKDMNTSLKVHKLETYAVKDADDAVVEKTATWNYLSGDTVKADRVVEQVRKSNGEKLSLIASSLSEDISITSDMCVLSLYKQCDGMTDEEIEAYSRLQSMIITAGSIIQDDYSEPSYKALRDAIAEASALSTISTLDEFNAAYNAIEAAQAALKTATTTVIVSSNPSNSGILTGGGRYAVDEVITLKARAVSGYRFLGWYEKDSDTVLSENTTYEVNVTAETASELSYVAKYQANENSKLSLTVGNGSVSYSYTDGTQTGTWDNSFMRYNYAKGTIFTVTALPDAGYTFLYWINSDGRVLSDSETYSFQLADDMKLEACYKKNIANKRYVVFKDMNGRILWSGDVALNETDDGESYYGIAEIPEHGTYTGYTFNGWKDSAGNIISTEETGFINVTEDVIICADYAADKDLTLTVNGVVQNQTYEYASMVTVNAEESRNGKYFSGWYIDDKLVSENEEYTFYITDDISLTARYDGEAVIEKQPIVNMTMGERIAGETKDSVVMDVTWAVPEGYTFAEAGLILTQNSDQVDNLKLENVGSNGIVKVSSKLTTSGGLYSYTLSMGSSSRTKNVYASGYITYSNNATGEVLTKYTEVYTSSAS